VDPVEGIWIGSGEILHPPGQGPLERLRRRRHGEQLVVDDKTLWIATDDGAIRFDPAAAPPPA
jgi:hypothetical protein